MNKVADEITLSLLVRIEAKGGRYQSSCPAIDVASAGRTIDEALTNIHEAVEQKLEDWVEEGLLLDELRRLSVPFVSGRRSNLPARADIPPGVLAATLNQYVRLT
ncbi:MAG TPA: type II toxin-antitoxin system HicB family antitoxin [Chloroflexota bacterium]|jgi:predicted RNase H-like HicB family nuclease|nr:type II toxin-antitoxin system HicB family antitoxin [Chloroflexota bacterium]